MARAAALAAVAALIVLAVHLATSARQATGTIERRAPSVADGTPAAVVPDSPRERRPGSPVQEMPGTPQRGAPPPAASEAEVPVLVGRLVHVNGRPVANEAFQMTLHAEDGARLRGQPTGSDANGRFVYPVPYLEPPLTGLRLTARERSAAPRRWTATVELPPLAPGVANDVGDVVVHVEAVGVRVRLALPGETSPHEDGFVDADLVLWGLDGEHEHDRGDARVGATLLTFDGAVKEGWITDRRGALEYADGESSAFLDPEQPDAMRRAVGLRTGVRVRAGDDVVLRTVMAGTVEGSVRLAGPGEENIFEGTVARVRLLSAGAPSPRSWGFDTSSANHLVANLAADGTFRVSDVEPGPYRLEVVRSGTLPLATIDGIEVLPGAVTTDPRLHGIDLDAHLDSIVLWVQDRTGSTIESARATVVEGGGSDLFPGHSGRVVARIPRVPAGVGLARIVVDAPGYIPTELGQPLMDRTVVLEPVQSIEVHATSAFESDTGSHGFFFRLRRVDAPEALADHWCTELPWGWNGEDEASIAVPGSGRYELEVKVRQRMGSMFGHTPYDRYVPTGTFVAVGPGATSVTLEIPDDLLRFAPR